MELLPTYYHVEHVHLHLVSNPFHPCPVHLGLTLCHRLLTPLADYCIPLPTDVIECKGGCPKAAPGTASMQWDDDLMGYISTHPLPGS
ncbi:hypothetical protein NPIL_267351 [Nephila pilipes]|uniref:Uncharacterized protein n=1 Tax=Nephila pilipes TaxID=299642 RepID=A0A8X6T3M2_NEPPI|nr:hypothetical protein NPIL_267351 [Nephila pilipes]